jgi:hypothetical protein
VQSSKWNCDIPNEQTAIGPIADPHVQGCRVGFPYSIDPIGVNFRAVRDLRRAFTAGIKAALAKKAFAAGDREGNQEAIPYFQVGVVPADVLSSVGVSAARTGNLLQSGSRGCGVRKGGIPERNDARQPFVAIDDRKTADLNLAHVAGHVVDIIVFETVLYVTRHHFPDFRIASEPIGKAADDQIPIRDRSDELVVVTDGQKADLPVGHAFGNFGDRLVRTGDLDIARHDL